MSYYCWWDEYDIVLLGLSVLENTKIGWPPYLVHLNLVIQKSYKLCNNNYLDHAWYFTVIQNSDFAQRLTVILLKTPCKFVGCMCSHAWSYFLLDLRRSLSNLNFWEHAMMVGLTCIWFVYNLVCYRWWHLFHLIWPLTEHLFFLIIHRSMLCVIVFLHRISSIFLYLVSWTIERQWSLWWPFHVVQGKYEQVGPVCEGNQAENCL